MIKIFVTSDTHGLSQRKLEKIIEAEAPDYTIHCGDHCMNNNNLNQLFDFYVRGNNDFNGDDSIEFKIGNITFKVIHGHIVPRITYKEWLNGIENIARNSNCNILLFGHSHRFYIKKLGNNKFMANPGSFALPYDIPSYLLIYIDNNEIRFKRVTLEY